MQYCVQNTKHKQKKKIKYKNFPHKVARFQISEVWNPNESSSDELRSPEKQPTPNCPKQVPHIRLYTDFSKHELDKIVAGGESKQYPTRQWKVHAADKNQRETGHNCKFCIAPHHKGSCFKKYYSIRNWQTLYMQFIQYWVQEYHLYSQTVTNNITRVWTSNVCKMSRNWGYLNLSRRMTHQAVSPLNSRTATKVSGGGFNSTSKI